MLSKVNLKKVYLFICQAERKLADVDERIKAFRNVVSQGVTSKGLTQKEAKEILNYGVNQLRKRDLVARFIKANKNLHIIDLIHRIRELAQVKGLESEFVKYGIRYAVRSKLAFSDITIGHVERKHYEPFKQCIQSAFQGFKGCPSMFFHSYLKLQFISPGLGKVLIQNEYPRLV